MGTGLAESVAALEAPRVVPLSVEQYHAMIEKGILQDGAPIELVEGLLLRKNRAASGQDELTHGARHALVLARLIRVERRLDALGCHARLQLPVTLSEWSEPEPDLAIVRGAPEAFAARHPRAEDVLAVFEVADSSLRYDRGTKLKIYATAGVPSYVLVNLVANQVELHEEPIAAEGRYQRRMELAAGASFALRLGSGSLELSVDELM